MLVHSYRVHLEGQPSPACVRSSALGAVQTFTCLDAGSLPNNKVLGCCKEPCSTFTNAAGAATSGVCCPWGAQTVTINGVVTRICCPQGTTVQPDGSCKACAAPTIPCNTWPTLGATQCCPDDQCLPVLPFNSTGPRACCPQVWYLRQLANIVCGGSASNACWMLFARVEAMPMAVVQLSAVGLQPYRNAAYLTGGLLVSNRFATPMSCV
jgi:hypothetical protein